MVGFAHVIAAKGGTKLVLPAMNELIWGTIAFLLFLLILWRAGVWRRLGEAMDERQRRIRTDLEKAETARKEAEELLERYRQQLREAREEARKIQDEARESAEKLRKDLREKAEQDAKRILESARQEIRAEQDRARRELQREVGVLAVQVAERIVGGSLDGDRQLELVDGYIEELTRQAGSSNGNGTGRRG